MFSKSSASRHLIELNFLLHNSIYLPIIFQMRVRYLKLQINVKLYILLLTIYILRRVLLFKLFLSEDFQVNISEIPANKV